MVRVLDAAALAYHTHAICGETTITMLQTEGGDAGAWRSLVSWQGWVMSSEVDEHPVQGLGPSHARSRCMVRPPERLSRARVSVSILDIGRNFMAQGHLQLPSGVPNYRAASKH